MTGRWVRMAEVWDEELVEGEVVRNPPEFVRLLMKSGLGADIFSFAERLPQTTPRYGYHFEWDNLAAVPITTYLEWWEGRLPQESRKNVRRAGKRGIVVRPVSLSDELIVGIKHIYDETGVRQGRRFWHYGKDLEAVREINGTYQHRSQYIGAFLKDELVGFVKVTYVERIATLIQILAMNKHRDKRPMNALLAHTVKLCEQRKISWLVYGKYTYGNKTDSSLAEFKRRNGFEEVRFPRYYVPLTPKGKLAMTMGLHQGIGSVIPSGPMSFFLRMRAGFYRFWCDGRQRVGGE